MSIAAEPQEYYRNYPSSECPRSVTSTCHDEVERVFLPNDKGKESNKIPDSPPSIVNERGWKLNTLVGWILAGP